MDHLFGDPDKESLVLTTCEERQACGVLTELHKDVLMLLDSSLEIVLS